MSRTNFLAAFALSLITAACGVDSEPAQDAERPLTVEQLNNTVRGTLMTADGEIRFSIEQTPMGTHTILTGEKGLDLLEVKISRDRQDLWLLGAHHLFGRRGDHKTIESDLLDDVAGIPEMRHVDELADALAAHGIDLETALGEIGCRFLADLRQMVSDAVAEND